MKRWLLSLVLACIASAAWAIGPGTVATSGLSQQSSFYYNVNGTYAASLLPKWCVNAHTTTATAAQNVSLIQSVGASCARVDASNWDTVEQSIGVYTWTNSDTLWNAICGAFIHPIFVATYNNTLYGASSVFTLISGSTQITGYSNYTVAGVNRLITMNGCTNLVLEPFNEANLLMWTGTQWTGQAYIGVAATVAAAAKAAQPGITVITSGPSPGTGTSPAPWIGGAVGSSPTLTNFSGYGLHPYSYNEGTPALTGVPTTQLAVDTISFSLSAGSGIGQNTAKPIYITEYGFPLQAFGSAPTTCASLSTCQTQGIYMAYAMLTSVALFTPYFTEYDLVDDGTSYSASDQNTFGLFLSASASIGNPVTPLIACAPTSTCPFGMKPQGTAFKSVTGCTAGTTTFTLSYNTSNNVETETFNKSSGACLAIFTWDASSTKSYSANIGTFSSVTCADTLGNSVSCTYTSGNLSMSVSAAVGPVIVTAVN